MDSNRDAVMSIFRKTYGDGGAGIWFNRWRIFFMACAELFAFSGGNDWFVSQYLLKKASAE
jgi:cyclopropane-fatty-acyl-phospholipid synthase